jgi:hypothetical protein
MAVQRTKVQLATESAPEVVDAHAAANAPAPGPVAVPDAEAPVKRGRGGKRGKRGPSLSWGQVVNGSAKTLSITVVEVARELTEKFHGRATLADVVAGLKSHPIFTDNVSADGVALSDLVSITNVRNKWHALKTNYSIGWAMKPESEGGLGLTGTYAEVAAQLTDAQWNQMEDQIAKPKPEGLNFPKLVIMRGRKGQVLTEDDI